MRGCADHVQFTRFTAVPIDEQNVANDALSDAAVGATRAMPCPVTSDASFAE